MPQRVDQVQIGDRVLGRAMSDGRPIVGIVVAQSPLPNGECVCVAWDPTCNPPAPEGWRKRTSLTVLPRGS